MKYLIILFIFILFIPIVITKIFFGSGGGTDQTLAERNFSLNGKQFSILVPKNLYSIKTGKGDVQVSAFGNGGQNISAVLVRYERLQQPLEDATCSSLHRSDAFEITNTSINKGFEICKTISKDNIAKGDFEFSLDYVDGLDYYFVIVDTKESYSNSDEGQAKVKQIFESFRIL